MICDIIYTFVRVAQLVEVSLAQGAKGCPRPNAFSALCCGLAEKAALMYCGLAENAALMYCGLAENVA